jgi:hypothetical protein
VTYGDNHCVLHTGRLQKKGNQVDRAGTTRESDRVRITAKEVGLTETIVLTSRTGNRWFHMGVL